VFFAAWNVLLAQAVGSTPPYANQVSAEADLSAGGDLPARN
jgi:hypothetical protein